MLAVVTKLDGLNFLLFHVEQQTPYEYKWRIDREGCEWSLGKSTGKRAERVFPCESGCRVEVQWRGLSKEGEGVGRWRKAALHEFASGSADFAIEPLYERHVIKAGEEVILIAPSEFVEGAASYSFTPSVDLSLIPGSPRTVRAKATGPYPFNHIPVAGSFISGAGPFRVTNLTRSEGSLVSVKGESILLRQNPPTRMYAAITRKPKA